jgi:hypothetical protein
MPNTPTRNAANQSPLSTVLIRNNMYCLLRRGRCIASLSLLLLIALSPEVRAEVMQPAGHLRFREDTSQAKDDSSIAIRPAENPVAGGSLLKPMQKLIVIGFMGGNVSPSNLVHREAQLIEVLQRGYPLAIHAALFANRDGDLALRTVLQLLDEDRDGHLSDHEKNAARIVIFGHSWGASETVTLAGKLNQLAVPVLLTVQVDSVQKQSQNDKQIPPNVQEAINFYQSEGLLHGRNRIFAIDPNRTKILGNHESTYQQNPVSCAGYPWYARAFMKRHIQIENDPVVWGQIQSLILAKIL